MTTRTTTAQGRATAQRVDEALRQAGFRPSRCHEGRCLEEGFVVFTCSHRPCDPQAPRVIVDHVFQGLEALHPLAQSWYTPRLREYRKALEAAGFLVRKDVLFARLEVE